MAGRKKQTDVSLPAKKQRRRGVTKDELNAELARFATREELDAKFSTKNELKAELARFATREELDAKFSTKNELKAESSAIRAEMAAGFAQVDARFDSFRDQVDARFDSFRDQVDARFDSFRDEMEAIMNATMARHIGAAMEEVRSWFRALDDKYRDLPARVAALEERAEK